MCRLAAYLGQQIPIENIVIRPKHSLLVQSHDALESKIAVNGDGFGIAWYGDDPEPGLYRDILPAWADENLTNLCRVVKSRLFLAHVRASTTGATNRSNCHPFSYENWAFMHNGQVGDFETIGRPLEALLANELYNARKGTTDSELLFLLLLQFGLANNPKKATEELIRTVTKCALHNNLDPFLRLTCVFSNGEQIYGFRYATDEFSPTLYFANALDNGGVALSSEPLDGDTNNWSLIEANSFVEIANKNKQVSPLDV